MFGFNDRCPDAPNTLIAKERVPRRDKRPLRFRYIVAVMFALMAILGLAANSRGRHYQSPVVHYVSKSGNDANDGLSWATAKLTVNGVLSTVNPGDQVWVATGTYTENFYIQQLSVYGGFAGFETNLSQRFISQNPTVIDGHTFQNQIYAEVAVGGAGADTLDGLTLSSGAQGVVVYTADSFTMTNCSVVNNSGPADSAYSGGLEFDGSPSAGATTVDIENTTISNNAVMRSDLTQPEGGAILAAHWGSTFGTFTMKNCVVDSNYAGASTGGVYVVGYESVDVDSCSITNNLVTAEDSVNSGAMMLTEQVSDANSNLNLCNDLVDGNSGVNWGGLYTVGFNQISINRCGFSLNQASNTSYGYIGAAEVDSANTLTIANSLFAQNTPQCIQTTNGVATAVLVNGISTITNNTFADNPSRGFVSQSGAATLENNIVTNNDYWGIENWSGTMTSNYDCLYLNYWGNYANLAVAGPNDIIQSPGFVNEAAGNYHLLSSSVCINRGDNSAVVGTLDLDGNPRIQFGQVDIGCYESPVTYSDSPPVAVDDYLYCPYNANATGSPTGYAFDYPLTYDSASNGGALSIQSLGTPSNGRCSINIGAPNWQVVYIPNAGYSGPDQYTVTIQDSSGLTATSTTYVTVGGSQDGINQRLMFNYGGYQNIDAAMNDAKFDPAGNLWVGGFYATNYQAGPLVRYGVNWQFSPTGAQLQGSAWYAGNPPVPLFNSFNKIAIDPVGVAYMGATTNVSGNLNMDMVRFTNGEDWECLFTNPFGNAQINAMCVDIDGPVMVGSSTNGSNTQAVIVKNPAVNNTGVQYFNSVLWSSVTGGNGPDNSWNGVASVPGGGIFVVGTVDDADADRTVDRFDPAGNLLWSYASNAPGVDKGAGVVVASDGNPVIAGTVNGSVLVEKHDATTGAIIWSQVLPMGQTADVHHIGIDPSNNLYISGNIAGSSTDVLLIKCDPNGNLLWSKTYDGGNGANCEKALVVDGWGNSYVAGTFSTDPNGDGGIAAYGPDGTLRWQRTFRGSASLYGVVNGIDVSPDGRIGAAGTATLPGSYHNFNIIGIDQVAIATNDSYSTEGPLNVAAPGVLANDQPVGVPSPTLSSNVTNGTLTFNSDGSFAYIPNAGFTGTDSFQYTISRAGFPDSTATVTINVTATTVANPQSVTTNQNTPVNITLTATAASGNPLTYSIVASPTNGALTGTPPNLTYTPTSGFNGQDSFTFTASDGVSTSNVATVSITVLPALSSLTISPSSVPGGVSSTGTVTLSGNAPATGIVVTLTSNKSDVTVPPSITIAGGQATGTFTITTTPETANETAKITATAGTLSASANLAVKAPVPSTLTLNPTSVVGTQTSTGTVTLTGNAPSGGTVVTLASTNSAATAPPSVTVPGGSNSATFTVTTTDVAANTTGAIQATVGTTTRSANLTVTPLLKSVSVSPKTVAGGGSVTGTVTLNSGAPSGGVTIGLSSNNPAASVPGSVPVAQGATTATFTVTTTTVSANTAVTITATSGLASQTCTLTVDAAGLSGITLSPASVTGGVSSTGTVTLNAAAGTGGVVVALSSGDPSASVPSSVTVQSGSTTGTFTVTTVPVDSTTVAPISGTLGSVTKTANLTVKAAALSSLTLSPTSLLGGNPSTGTVTLSGAAGPSGVSVALTSSDPSSTVPSSVTVPAGSTTATFTVTTVHVDVTTVASISGTVGAVTKSANLTVKAAALSSLTLSPTSLIGGNSSTGTVTLSGAAGPCGASVALSSGNAAASCPASVTVPAGSTTASFAISTTAVSVTTAAAISATLGTVTKSANLTIKAAALSSLTLSPTSAKGGVVNSTGTVTLTGVAPSGGYVISLSSNSVAGSVPASVTVPAGFTSATFTVTTSSVAKSTSVKITATDGTVTKTATLTVTT